MTVLSMAFGLYPHHYLACVAPETGAVTFVPPLKRGRTRPPFGVIIAKGDINAMTRVRGALACDAGRSKPGALYHLPGLPDGSTRPAILAAAADLALNLELRP